jgi:hypothetical protein
VTLTPPDGTETPLLAVSKPVIPAPPDDTVSVLVDVNVPVTVLLPVIPAPPDDTVNAPVDDSVPVTATLPVIVAPPDAVTAPEKVTPPPLAIVMRGVPPVERISPRVLGEFIVELDASADMVVRDTPLLDS